MPKESGTVFIDKGSSSQKNEEVSASKNDGSKIDELVKRANWIIFETKSVFPFELFPDKLAISPNRIVFTYSKLFYKDEYPIPIESVTGARVYRNLFFASLNIETFGLAKPESLKYLKPNEARMARRYILALVECKKNNIDLSGLSLRQIREKLNQIGMVREGFAKEGSHKI